MKKSKRTAKKCLPKAIKNLRQGQTIWKVSEYSDTIQEMRVEGRPYETFCTFLDVSYVYKDYPEIGRLYSSCSLMDGNFSDHQNSYNGHKLFTSKGAATKYLREMKDLGFHKVHSVNSRNLDHWSLLDDMYADDPYDYSDDF